ncbi:hypothetical protein JOB18_020338 [Solea senegalensis]|uniref:Uncharacterized protein n=1 Tax=Solea senegalensis TaxID=28829 RepID=A0AAV6RAT1_SOLSE|nr:hypothetical protein JOB18_020338 [Solea senegalensis]
MRAHELAFTFGSSTSTFFQLHIVNCTGLREEKVATLRSERCKSADGHEPRRICPSCWIAAAPFAAIPTPGYCRLKEHPVVGRISLSTRTNL